MTSPLAAGCCHYHRTISHAPDSGHWRYAVWLVAAEWRHCSTGHGFPQDHCSAKSRHCLCQPRPARPGHHTNYCTVHIYSTSTQNRKPLIIICYKIFLFPRNKEAFPKYVQLHLSTVNCSSLPSVIPSFRSFTVRETLNNSDFTLTL